MLGASFVNGQEVMIRAVTDSVYFLLKSWPVLQNRVCSQIMNIGRGPSYFFLVKI